MALGEKWIWLQSVNLDNMADNFKESLYSQLLDQLERNRE